MSSTFIRTGSQLRWQGRIAGVREDTFRHEDGEEVSREIVTHPGAVGVLAHDDERMFLVRQPREPVGVPDLLEIPAGKLDVEGEEPIEAAKRELAEEIGKAAEAWTPLGSHFTSPGFSDEIMHLFLATGLSERPTEVEENERIDLVTWPLEDLDSLIDQVRDGKTLVALLQLRRRLG